MVVYLNTGIVSKSILPKKYPYDLFYEPYYYKKSLIKLFNATKLF